jgi:hypothetical protein
MANSIQPLQMQGHWHFHQESTTTEEIRFLWCRTRAGWSYFLSGSYSEGCFEVVQACYIYFRNFPRDVKVTAYMTIVCPKLEYACAAWDPHFKKKMLLSRERQHDFVPVTTIPHSQCHWNASRPRMDYLGVKTIHDLVAPLIQDE